MKVLTKPGDARPRGIRLLLAVSLSPVLLTSIGGSALGQNQTDTDAGQRAQLAESFVKEKLAAWQRNLGLEDWKISIVMSRRSDLKPKTLGGIRWDKANRSAVLRVLAVPDYQVPVREMLDDMEQTIVHELVHIHLSSLPRSEASRREEERAVNQLAQALLKLDRRNR